MMISGAEAKPNWAHVPMALVKQIEEIIGDCITDAQICWGGYSASASFHVTTQSGKAYFIKGSHDQEMAHGAKILAQEIAIYQNWPLLQKKGPAFLGSVHEDDEDGWHLGIWDFIPAAQPVTLKTQQDIEQLFCAIGQYHFNVKQRPNFVPKMSETQFVKNFLDTDLLWPRIYYKKQVRTDFLKAFDKPNEAEIWLDQNYTHLLKYLSRIQYIEKNADKRQAMLHFDLRLDNIVQSADKIYLIDWPNLCWGPALFDIVHLSAYLAANTPFSAAKLCQIYQDVHEITYDADDILAVIASLSGYYGQNIYKETPKAMPRLRVMQRQIFSELMTWFAEQSTVENMPILKP